MSPIKRTKFKLAPEQLLETFYWLKLMRAFDLRLSILVRQGKVRSGVYTGIGQEAIIVGTCYALRKEDFICPLHRDLGAFLMKGVEPGVMMSQMFAKTTGLSKGRDSALHSGVNELGIFGNTSMLGANLPVAAGLALTYKMEESDNVVIAYFGEGASNVGDFHEALNFAGVQQLPVIFLLPLFRTRSTEALLSGKQRYRQRQPQSKRRRLLRLNLFARSNINFTLSA